MSEKWVASSPPSFPLDSISLPFNFFLARIGSRKRKRAWKKRENRYGGQQLLKNGVVVAKVKSGRECLSGHFSKQAAGWTLEEGFFR